jgi:hypothetical protein
MTESYELYKSSVPADKLDLRDTAGIAAAYAAATQGVLAAGRQQRQQRQQLRLRLISMVGSCVKAMSGQWQLSAAWLRNSATTYGS